MLTLNGRFPVHVLQTWSQGWENMRILTWSQKSITTPWSAHVIYNCNIRLLQTDCTFHNSQDWTKYWSFFICQVTQWPKRPKCILATHLHGHIPSLQSWSVLHFCYDKCNSHNMHNYIARHPKCHQAIPACPKPSGCTACRNSYIHLNTVTLYTLMTTRYPTHN